MFTRLRLRAVFFATMFPSLALLALLFLTPSLSPAVMADDDDAPEPLPEECGGVNPGGPEAACCAYGYVYFEDAPALGASVTISSARYVTHTFTHAGPASDYAYFSINLDSDSFRADVGEWLTVTAAFSDSSASVAYRVVPGAQQMDVVLPGVPRPSYDAAAGDFSVPVGEMVFVDNTPTALAATALAGQNVLPVASAAGFAVNDEVFIIQMVGAGAGVYQYGVVSSTGSVTLTLTDDLSYTFSIDSNSRAQVLRVPHYRNVTVEGILTTHGWNGITGSVMLFKASGVVTVAAGGRIDVTGMGYLGGPGGDENPGSNPDTGSTGGSYTGPPLNGPSAPSMSPEGPENGGGGRGGRGARATDSAAGGGGGSYGSLGTAGDNALVSPWAPGGQPGLVYGVEELAVIYPGSGGGGGGKGKDGNGALGGSGGGIVIVHADTLLVYGNILANGTGGSSDPPGNGGGGGGGSGGSVFLSVGTATLGTGLVNAIGGGGGQGNVGGNGGNGGSGGAGRIRVEYGLSPPSGSTNPAASVQSWEALGTPIATIHAIYPHSAYQDQTVYFSGSGRDTDEAGNRIVAYDWRSDVDGSLSQRQSFSLRAAQLSPVTHTISLRVQDDEGEWSPAVTRTLVVNPSPQDVVRTLILVNRQKLAELYSAPEADQVLNSLSALAAHASVKGLLLQVENDAAVAAAYQEWDDDPSSTDAANAVTEAIRDLVLAHWADNPDLAYLVIVGDDRVIPFHRVRDRTRYSERRYRQVSKISTIGAALRDDMTLTDDYYADAAPTRPQGHHWGGHALYIPDLGVGRLVETPWEIIGQALAFLSADEVAVNDALVTGYDFLQDGAQAVCNTLNDDEIPTDCALIGQGWGRTDFISHTLDLRHDIVSFNGHATHSTIGTPNGSLPASDIAAATADHARALFYTVGCHSGLNVPPSNPYHSLDTAQALAQKQANYVANTGYGWGYRRGVGLAERLMLNFTEQLVYGQSATLGEALARAKQAYYLGERRLDYYDEKIMIESVLYGLPMYRYRTSPGSSARQPNREALVNQEQQLEALAGGLTVNRLRWSFPDLALASTDEGHYYTLEGLAYLGDGEPIQPQYVADLYFPGLEAHGAVLRGGAYTDVLSFDPVIEYAVTETAVLTEPVFSAPGWYPARLHQFNALGDSAELVTLLGQFNPLSQTERLYHQLSFDVYYHAGSDDWSAPGVLQLTSALGGGYVTLTVRAADVSGIQAVVAAYDDGLGSWRSVELTPDGDWWRASWPGSATTPFLVQVVDGAGNVAAIDNDEFYFVPGDEIEGRSLFLPLALKAP